jgi:hypothetical protein
MNRFSMDWNDINGGADQGEWGQEEDWQYDASKEHEEQEQSHKDQCAKELNDTLADIARSVGM